MSPKKRPTKPIDIYCRVSRSNGRDVTGEGGSAAEQARRCRALLEADGLEVGEVFEDIDESGAKKSRPGFDRMLTRIESGESGGVCVFNLSRLTRAADLADRILWIEEYGATFISCQEKVDTSTPTGLLVIRVLDAINAMKVDEARAQFASDQDRALARGVRVGPAPAGYGKAPDGRLVKREPGATRIGNAIRLRARGGSWSAVARALEGVGTSRRKGGRWTNSGARNLVCSKIYKGVLGYYADGSPCVVPDLAVVPPSVWQKAQPVASGGTRDRESVSVLSGILVCSGCGRKLTRSSTTRNGKRYTYWQCKTGAQFCAAPASAQDEAAFETVREYVLGSEEPEIGGAFLPGLILGAKAGRETDPVREAELENVRDGASAELAAFLAVARASDPGFEDAVAERRAALEQAEAALAEERGSSVEHRTPEQIRADFDAGSLDEQRTLLRYFLEKVVVDRGSESVEKRLHFFTREEPWKEGK
jgi:DNA invertase Pin-like site-specific DNA recombinase